MKLQYRTRFCWHLRLAIRIDGFDGYRSTMQGHAMIVARCREAASAWCGAGD